MAWFQFGKRSWEAVAVAGIACGLTAGPSIAEEPPLHAADGPEISVLKPDEDLGPIYRLPETSSANQAEDAPNWKPNWRQPASTQPTSTQPTPTRSAPPSRPAVHDPLAPPEIDLPTGTDAPPTEPEPAKHSSSRRRYGSTRTADSTTSAPTYAPAHTMPSERRGSRAKVSRSTQTAPTLSPADVEIPGITDLSESPTLPEANLPGEAKDSPPARRGFMSRIFRSTPPSPADGPRPARTGWGGLFRSGPVSR